MATLAVMTAVLAMLGCAQPEGTQILARDALLTSPVGGLERTSSRAETVAVSGMPFAKALRVTIGAEAEETNATQLTIPNTAPVERGDVMIASFHIRGQAAVGPGLRPRPARMEFLFERSTNPWTKSVSHGASAPAKAGAWRAVHVPFRSAETYAPGQAMASLRLAFGPQTIEIGGLEVRNFGKTRTLEDVIAAASEMSPLGAARITLHPSDKAQRMVGFGGNFCQPRYGSTEAMDAVGRWNLENLNVAHARVGIPLNWWAPERGVYKDEAQARASFLLMQTLSRRKIAIVGSVWEGPAWMLGGAREQMGPHAAARQVRRLHRGHRALPDDRARHLRRDGRALLVQRGRLRRQLQVHAGPDRRVHQARGAAVSRPRPEDEVPGGRHG
jgi:hypothetical protein